MTTTRTPSTAPRTVPIVALSVPEAALSVSVSEDTIYAKIRSGELYAVRFGKEPGKGDYRIGLEELRRCFERPEETA